MAAISLAGCATNPTTGAIGLSAGISDFIQAAVAAAAKYVPTVESIVATAASLFGAQYSAIVQIGTAAINSLISTLVSIVGTLPSATLRAMLAGSSPLAPVVIGTTSGGIVVTGFRVSALSARLRR